MDEHNQQEQRTPQRKGRRRMVAGLAALAIAGAASLGGIAADRYVDDGTSSSAAASTDWSGPSSGDGFGGLVPPGYSQGYGPDYGSDYRPDYGSGGLGGGTSQGNATDKAEASSAQQTGIVTIDTVVDYGQARAAGSGIVLSSDGLVLTNHHVIEGATTVTVTVESTGLSYQAEVVGSDASHDVAVLKLEDASGLTPAPIDDDHDLAVGDQVTAVGNANGGGELLAASGTVTGLGETITAGSEATGEGETLSNLIEANVDVVSGDSGGAMLDAEGEVVGMTTAASSGTPDITGYAVPIDTALSIAQQIESGDESGSVTVGSSAFLGVMIGQDGTISGAVDGSPAAGAGIAAGDTITAVDDTEIASTDDLTQALASHDPGDRVTITWTSPDGSTHTATVTLAAGPAS